MRVITKTVAHNASRAALALPRQAGRCRLAAAATPAAAPCHWRQHLGHRVAARSSGGGSAADDPGEDLPAPTGGTSSGSGGSGSPAETGSSSSGRGQRAVSLPRGLPTAGAVFMLAGALKLLIMCFPFSEMAIMMYLQGRADLGMKAALKAVPLALGLAALAKAIVDRQLQDRRWVQVAILAGAVAALYASRIIFARPKRSPLDPMFHRLNQERAAAVADQRRTDAEVEQRQRQHLLKQPESERGQQLLQQQQAQAQVQARAKN